MLQKNLSASPFNGDSNPYPQKKRSVPKSKAKSPLTHPYRSITMGGTTNVAVRRIEISESELSECDRLKLNRLGAVQSDAGHVMYFSYPEGKILALDTQIREKLSWFKHRGHPSDLASAGVASSDEDASASAGATSSGNSVQSEEIHSLAQDVLGSSLVSWIPYALHKEIYKAIGEMKKGKSQRAFHFFSYHNRSYAISLSTTKMDMSVIGMEIELIDEGEAEDGFYDTLVSLGRVMDLHADESLVNTACDTVFRLLGQYDRGMVYKFHDDLSGDIVHEIIREDSGITSSYKGMRFPAGDIPLSARQLYIKNGLRYIRDADGDDVQIIDSVDGDIDLTHCRMRACAKPHLIYMKNMGVKCSMSIAIVVEDQLWGLLAFHGYTKPFKPSLHQRIACETINSMMSVKVEALQKKAQSNRIVQLSKSLMKWRISESVASNIEQVGPEILMLLDADVLAGWFKDPSKPDAELVIVGDKSLAPSDGFWTAFSEHPLRELQVMSSRAEISSVGLDENDCPASGVVYFRDSLFQIMVGRGLRSKDVRWAGNPDEPKLRLNGVLCPRASFDLYMQKAKKESKAWSQSDMHVLRRLMEKTGGYAHNRMMTLLRNDIEEANVKYMNELNRARDNHDFFSQIAHEIRTPFHGVMGCLNIIEESRNDMPSEEVKDLLKTALVSGSHMTNLLDNILQIAMNKYLSHSLKLESFDYRSLASEIIQSLKSLALNKQIKFTSEIFPKQGSIAVEADRTKVIQIVSNLINNAIKFAPGGTIDVQFQLTRSLRGSIQKWSESASTYNGSVFSFGEKAVFNSISDVRNHVSQLPESQKHQWILVSVKDSGVGMKPDEIGEMLKPYTQTQYGNNAALQGTGLGLFICVSLCHQMEGFLACSSTSGSGTIFHVGIPVGEPKESKEYSDDSETSSGGECTVFSEEIPVTGPILVCDDNAVNRKILNRSLATKLKKFGMDIKILEADGGESCVETFIKERPSILFIDYHMPKVDGLEATKRIRKFEADNGLNRSYIVSYTADVTEKANNLLRSNGTNEIMSKPPPKGFLDSVVGRFWMQNNAVGDSTVAVEGESSLAPMMENTKMEIASVGSLSRDQDTTMEDETAHKKRSYDDFVGKTPHES